MSLLTLILAEAHEELAELIAPAWVFPLIAAVFFVLVAAVTWSFRDVAHRHNDKTSGADAHGGHH